VVSVAFDGFDGFFGEGRTVGEFVEFCEAETGGEVDWVFVFYPEEERFCFCVVL